MLSPEELLKSRYKVIADWPGSHWLGYWVDDVVNEERNLTKNNVTIFSYEFDRWPHLFKKLEWHQERRKDEMPDYIKWTEPGTKEVSFFKVEEWFSNSAGVYAAHIYDPAAYLFIRDIEPATETEYNEYNLKLKNNE